MERIFEKEEEMKYEELHEVFNALWLADKNYDRKLNAYLNEKNPTRKRDTTLVAQKSIASEWLGKCELEFEKYINDRIIDGKFYLTNTPELRQKKHIIEGLEK